MKFAFFVLSFLVSMKAARAEESLKTPNISANALFLYQNSNFNKADTSTTRNGIDLQETELQFYSDVDPYSRVNLVLSVHPEYTKNSNGLKVDQEWKVEPEEAYAESNHIPATTLKLGKFKAAFGKSNLLHTHAFPLVDATLANSKLLGEEGLNDVGVSAAYFLPTPWFAEITGQYLRGQGENAEFSSPTSNDAVGLAHFKNLLDLNDSLTMELGASYASGRNSLKGITTLSGADLTFKWRPTDGGKYRSWILGSEFVQRKLEQPGTTTERGRGWNLWAQYQVSERWRLIGRYDALHASGTDSGVNSEALTSGRSHKYASALAFNASEFSSYKLEFDYARNPVNSDGLRIEKKIYLQANFTIGSHPAHSY